MKNGTDAQGRGRRGSRSVTTSAAQADCIQVVRSDLVGAEDQVLDVVVLRVEVATGQRVRPSRREYPYQLRCKLGGRPRRVVPELARHVGAYEAGTEEEDRDAPCQLGRERLPVPADRRLARRVRGLSRAREVRGAAARDHDASRAALEHSRNDRATAEMYSEDVHLEDVPPRLDRHLPGRSLLVADARV